MALTVLILPFTITIDHRYLSYVYLSILRMASPTVRKVFIEVNYLTVTGDCSCLVIILDRDTSILLSKTMTIIILACVDYKTIQKKTKIAFFLKLSHKMGHVTIFVCICFGGDLGGHLGLAINFLKTIR